MKLPASLILLSCLLAQGTEPIQSVPLDERVLVEVPVATNRVTTLNFPGPITAIDAASVTTDPKVQGEFQLAHTKGSSFLSVRALIPNARANVNIHWNKGTYVFLLVEDPKPVLSLNLVAPGVPKVLPAPRLPLTRLLALLDKAKAFPILKEQHAATVDGVEWRTFTGHTNVTSFGDFEIQPEEIYRFDPEDTLIFRVLIRNKSEALVEYEPGSLGLRAGTRVYPQSITDASGILPPRSETIVYVAVTGTPDGGRNELSLKNDFAFVVTRTSAAPPTNTHAP